MYAEQEREENRAAAVEDAFQSMLGSAHEWVTIWWAGADLDGPVPSVAQALENPDFQEFLRERAENFISDAEETAFENRGERLAAAREDREAGY